MRYLAMKITKNPLFKIMCAKCGKEIFSWARICTDNKMKSPSACFCEDCLKYGFKDLVKKHFNDEFANIKNDM